MHVVKIKTWEQLVAEFGITDTNNIDCHPRFTAEMEARISKAPGRIIEVEPQRKGAKIYERPLLYKPDEHNTWVITRDMEVSAGGLLGAITDDMRKKIMRSECGSKN